ncbi:MAG: hypothetical protein Q9195_008955 [Heterodermia aff. obscurata]
MSAILSADDLNDFISPGVACIKPVETLPLQTPDNAYEVTTEDKVTEHAPAQISLTDCLACSGCVTSAEAVLVSLQSHAEVLNTLDAHPAIDPSRLRRQYVDGAAQTTMDEGVGDLDEEGRLFVASVSPQVRASIAATYNVSEREAGHMIDHLLGGRDGLARGGRHGNSFTWIVDTNAMREASLVLGADEVLNSLAQPTSQQHPPPPKPPILTSACPGWICYAEKTHPHILPHLSRLKSPQALTGTLLKTTLSHHLHISPSQIWHLAIMPCFDKKLEASREELTDTSWRPTATAHTPIRDTDSVITARELLLLASSRGIPFASLPRSPLLRPLPFPDPILAPFLFRTRTQSPAAGTSGGYLAHILSTQLTLHPASTLSTTRGRNADVTDYAVLAADGTPLFRAARYYGFRNIQNLVRKLRPPKQARMPGARVREVGKGKVEYAYVEVMACPGGCTNGGGQIKGEDVSAREWLGRVDEAYFSVSEGESEDESEKEQERPDPTPAIRDILTYWSTSTGIPLEKLAYTSYRSVESEVGKGDPQERVVELAGRIGGGW